MPSGVWVTSEAPTLMGMLLAHEINGSSAGPSVVLLHGITETRHAWDPLIGELGASFRLLRVDLRGHGESAVQGPYDPVSYAGDVIETMAACGFDGASVIGHSLGGIVASAMAALGGAARVINVDQSLQLGAFKELLVGIEPMLRGDEATFQSAMDMIFKAMAGPLPAVELERIDALRDARQAVVLGTWDSVLSSTAAELDATVAALAGAIHVPYLALHGTDPGDDYAPWLTGLVPTAAVEVWADHGHYPHLDDPTRFIARVRDFVRS